MAGVKNPQDPLQPLDGGHPMPRRTTAAASVTLQHHRHAHEVAARLGTKYPSRGRNARVPSYSPPEKSSLESHESGCSDPKKWFDDSNRNPSGAFGAESMDVDPPFFQKDTDSSNDEMREAVAHSHHHYMHGTRQNPPRRPTVTHSSSADDYRSVIDDLTIENKRLKEELKRHRQFGPDVMKKDKLFEIKVHGIPKRKKRELEATLRDFAAGLESASPAQSPRRKSARHAKLYSPGESMSKHASSSSSQWLADSAYASMSGGGGSSASHLFGTWTGRPANGSRAKSSEQKLDKIYPRDTPEGLLHPRHVNLSEKEKKKLVVRKLEHLFTGKFGGTSTHRHQSPRSIDAVDKNGPLMNAAAPTPHPGASREAPIQPQDFVVGKPPSRDLSTSNLIVLNDDQTDRGGNVTEMGHGTRVGVDGTNSSHSTTQVPPEQRPTRPTDLDPDRVQNPSENMDYIRHLGLVRPEFLVGPRASHQDVSPDADGWVYLNLLCNLAQLHMVNVTPAFIRSAVTEKSAKFQLSLDGRKIRWRGGTDGTKFSSDSSGENSQKSSTTDDTDGSDELGQRKKQKTAGNGPTSAPTSEEVKEAKLGPSSSNLPGRFHYKPLFIRHNSSAETSQEESDSQTSEGRHVEINVDDSTCGYSKCGSRKRHRGGAIVYFNGASFCLDLSGDPGDSSPTTYPSSSTRESGAAEMPERRLHRTMSGSSLVVRPLSDDRATVSTALDMDLNGLSNLALDPDDPADGGDVDVSSELPWCDSPEAVEVRPFAPPLEPSGLGGVLPEDHFVVVVTTRRTILKDEDRRPRGQRSWSGEATDAVASRLAFLSTTSHEPLRRKSVADAPVEVEYMNGRIKRLHPLPLPPPALFFPSTTSDSEMDDSESTAEEEDENSGDEFPSRALYQQPVNRQHSGKPYQDGPGLAMGDAGDGVEGNNAFETDCESVGLPSPSTNLRRVTGGSMGVNGESAHRMHTASSVATIGDVESGYTSSVEAD